MWNQILAWHSVHCTLFTVHCYWLLFTTRYVTTLSHFMEPAFTCCSNRSVLGWQLLNRLSLKPLCLSCYVSQLITPWWAWTLYGSIFVYWRFTRKKLRGTETEFMDIVDTISDHQRLRLWNQRSREQQAADNEFDRKNCEWTAIPLFALGGWQLSIPADHLVFGAFTCCTYVVLHMFQSCNRHSGQFHWFSHLIWCK